MRVFIDDNNGDGITFGYRAQEQVNAVLFFKRGGVKASQEMKLTIIRDKKIPGKYRIQRTKVALPNNIASASGDLQVSGAIGVILKNQSDSKVSVPNPGQMKKKASYSPPMYFPLTSVKVGTGAFLETKFQIYGSIIGFNVVNPHNTRYTLRELDIHSKIFDTEDEMDLNTTQGHSPNWTSTQKTDDKKTIELVAREHVIGNTWDSRPFFFWVKPTTERITRHNNQFDLALKSFSTTNKPQGYDTGLEEIKYTVPVKNALVEGRVHRIPEGIQASKAGGLIFTEVFRGLSSKEFAIEIYNSSDEPIDLKDYELRSFDAKDRGGKMYTSKLLYADYSTFRVVLEPATGFQAATLLSGRKLQQRDIDNGVYTLQPKEMAIFFSTNVFFKRSQLIKRKKLRWMFNIEPIYADYWGFLIYAQGGYMELVKKGNSWQPGEVEDVFLKMKGDNQNQGHDVWSYTFMRKPDRNTPRKTMAQGSNSDWVSRDRTENIDWGYRFGFEYGHRSDPRSANNIWFDGASEQFNGMLEIAGNGRPLTYLNTDPNHAGFLRSWQTGTENQWKTYTVPIWWTKANGAH